MDSPDEVPESSEQNGKGRLSRVGRHLAQDVDAAWADLILLVLCFLSGIVDSAVFNVWSCFVSMQTGNTVYVGLGVSNQPLSQPYRWVKSGTAILFFCIGNFVFSRICRWVGPLKRGTMCTSLLIQASFCIAAAIMEVTGLVPRGAGNLLPKQCIVLLPLALLSFQSAGQIVMSRFLAYSELPTVVLTSTYCDLFMDPLLLTSPTGNAKRNRRALSALALVIGATIGGFLTVDGDIAMALWITAAVKIVLAGVWLVWPGKGSIRLE